VAQGFIEREKEDCMVEGEERMEVSMKTRKYKQRISEFVSLTRLGGSGGAMVGAISTESMVGVLSGECDGMINS
jgi:hypothetical protein